MTISPNVIQQTHKAIRSASAPIAVLLFAHGVERFSMKAETPTQEAQLQRTLREFSPHLVGVYTPDVALDALRDDLLYTEEQLFHAAD